MPFSIENFFKVQGYYFRLLGVDILAEERSQLYPLRIILSVLSVCTMDALVLVYILQNLEDVEKVSDALTAYIMNKLALFKFGLIIWLRKDFGRIIQQFHQILARECENPVHADIIQLENQRQQRISGIYANCFVLAGILSSLKPLMSTGLIFLITGEVQLEMNVPYVPPWDNGKLHNFLWSNVLLSAASFGVVTPIICIDTLIISIVHNVVALFKIAQHKIQFFVGSTLEETQRRLHDIIQLYKMSLDISNVIRSYFRLLICIQLVMASIHLCVLSFTLSFSFGQPQMPFYLVFVVAILIQLYLYCRCGEYLKTESQEFARAIYDSPWYEEGVIDAKIGRSLQFAMMRAQRGCHIDGYFFEANMEVFLSIVMTAMSYFTLLRSIS